MAKCGENKGIEALTSLGDSIKAAADSGAAGLDALAASADQALADFENAVASKIPKISLQDELRKLQSMGQGPKLEAAKLALKEKFGALGDKIDSIVDSAVPSLPDFSFDIDFPDLPDFFKNKPDVCEIENLELDPDGNIEKLAKPATTPSVAPTQDEPDETEVKAPEPEQSEKPSITTYTEALQARTSDHTAGAQRTNQWKFDNTGDSIREIEQTDAWKDLVKTTRALKMSIRKYILNSQEFKKSKSRFKEEQLNAYLEIQNLKRTAQNLNNEWCNVYTIIKTAEQRSKQPDSFYDENTLNSPLQKYWKFAKEHPKSESVTEWLKDVIAIHKSKPYYKIIGTKEGTWQDL
jgi:hypothetical protein